MRYAAQHVASDASPCASVADSAEPRAQIMAWRVHASNLQDKQKTTYNGPVAVLAKVYKDAPFELTYKKEHMNKDADSPAGIVRTSLKNIPLPGTEQWTYPKQSLTWMVQKNVWVAVNSYTLDEKRITKSISLEDWINHPVTRAVLNDEKLIMHFAFQNAAGDYISEEEAIAINKEFDVDAAPHSANKRVFTVGPAEPGPSGSNEPGPSGSNSPEQPASVSDAGLLARALKRRK